MLDEIFKLPDWEGMPRCANCGLYMIGVMRSPADPSRCVQCAGMKQEETYDALNFFDENQIIDA